ncbi:MAG: adenylosuccinate lyase [Pseudomonadota bacterium]
MSVTERSNLESVSPIDGRYARQTNALVGICSEFALIRYRVNVEVKWLMHLAASPEVTGLGTFDDEQQAFLTDILKAFDPSEGEQVKAIEKDTNHDVKAVEYYLQSKIQDHPTLQPAIPFIHFACTSEDINNLSYALMLRDARHEVFASQFEQLIETLRVQSSELAHLPMLSRTHGQSATPTTLGKEVANVVKRIERGCEEFQAINILGKMNGAVGNFNAHCVAYPDADWAAISASFIDGLGLSINTHTTQIEPHDWIAAYADALKRINVVLIDYCRDTWTYISLGYFAQRKVENETGSSTMPHKVNPIDFENAEGNLGIANALLGHFSEKLPISRMQRDLSDSTVLRNLGTALGHVLIALQSLHKGIGKLEVSEARLGEDIEQAWEILAEPVQTVMRAHGIADSYEQLKGLTRGKRIDQQMLHEFIDQLEIPTTAKQSLKELTPSSYLGVAAQLASQS